MAKHWIPEDIRARIDRFLPEGYVLPRHNEKGHFYQVDGGPVYPSVTGKLQILKDEGLINYKMNQAIKSMSNSIFANYSKITDENVMDIIEEASAKAARVSQDILEDAGDVGTRIHNLRETIFNKWIAEGVRPVDFPSFIPAEDTDIRVVSALRALEKFCIEREYVPVKCEMLLYSHSLKVAGTLDDLGLMKKYIRQPKKGCQCTTITDRWGWTRCGECDSKWRWEFVLMDLKTSNQFKDHYFFQVCLYWEMLWKIIGKEWRPERCFILKVSKEDGTYKIEDLKQPWKLAAYARHMIKTNEGVDFIKSLRKDNQKTIISL